MVNGFVECLIAHLPHKQLGYLRHRFDGGIIIKRHNAYCYTPNQYTKKKR